MLMKKQVLLALLTLIPLACMTQEVKHYVHPENGKTITELSFELQSRELQPATLAGPYYAVFIFWNEQKAGMEDRTILTLSMSIDKPYGEMGNSAELIINGKPYTVPFSDRTQETVREKITIQKGTALTDLPGNHKSKTISFPKHQIFGILDLNQEIRRNMSGMHSLTYRINIGRRTVTFLFRQGDIRMIQQFLTMDGKDFYKANRGCL